MIESGSFRKSEEAPASNYIRDGGTGNHATATHHSPLPILNAEKLYFYIDGVCVGRKYEGANIGRRKAA